MEILSDRPLRILSQGLTDTVVAYKNIENDLPFHEQLAEGNKVISYMQKQNDFNSAELYNQNLRLKNTTVISYDISDINSVYITQKFKLYKHNQILKTAKYLQKVLKQIFSIEKNFSRQKIKVNEFVTDKQISNQNEREIMKSRRMISVIFDVLWDINISIKDLESDDCSVDIENFMDDMMDDLRLCLSVRYVPDEVASKINALYPNLPLQKLSLLEGKNENKSFIYNCLKDLENRLYMIINLIVFNLSNQFSYYVTSEDFLNNPNGTALFVIPMSMYLMFNFYNSGLTKSESIKIDKEDVLKTNQRYLKFFKVLNDYFAELIQNVKKEIELASDEKEFFNIQMFLDYYRKMSPVDKTDKIESFISNPVVFEKMSTMVQKVKQNMVVSMNHGENPWAEIKRVHESKDIDNSTIYFLLKLFDCYPGELLRFPQAQMIRFLNLCVYASTFGKCMNEHVRRYKSGKYILTCSYKNLFEPILMN